MCGCSGLLASSRPGRHLVYRAVPAVLAGRAGAQDPAMVSVPPIGGGDLPRPVSRTLSTAAAGRLGAPPLDSVTAQVVPGWIEDAERQFVREHGDGQI